MLVYEIFYHINQIIALLEFFGQLHFSYSIKMQKIIQCWHYIECGVNEQKMQIYPQRWRTSAGLLRINDFAFTVNALFEVATSISIKYFFLRLILESDLYQRTTYIFFVIVLQENSSIKYRLSCIILAKTSFQ